MVVKVLADGKRDATGWEAFIREWGVLKYLQVSGAEPILGDLFTIPRFGRLFLRRRTTAPKPLLSHFWDVVQCGLFFCLTTNFLPVNMESQLHIHGILFHVRVGAPVSRPETHLHSLLRNNTKREMKWEMFQRVGTCPTQRRYTSGMPSPVVWGELLTIGARQRQKFG